MSILKLEHNTVILAKNQDYKPYERSPTKPTIFAPIVAQLTPFLFDFPSSQDGTKTSLFLDISDISVTT